MAGPATHWDTVPVHGTWRKIDGRPCSGSIRFTISTRVTDTTDDVIFPAGGIIDVPLGQETGSIAVDLPAVGDPDTTPLDWAIKVEEKLVGVTGLTYYIKPTLDMLPDGLNLRAVSLPAAGSVPPSALLRGIPGGVAALDADGDVVNGAGQKLSAHGDVTSEQLATTSTNDRKRENHTGTQSADTITDGTTNKAYTATEKTKLSGIASGATANSSDATLLARGNHTGTQSADTITDGTTNKAYTATEKTKLGGVATAATANSSDATLLARGNHTGTQTASTISDFASAAVSALASALSAKADDSAVVKLTGTQTIAGTKTFSSAPGVPDSSFAIAKVSGLQTALDAKAPLASPTFTGTVGGITKAMVGLTNVDNTADTDKPVSDAMSAALNAALHNTPGQIQYDTGTSAYPKRATVTTDTTRVIVFRGPVGPTFGSGWAIDGVDEWKKTT